MSLRDDLIEDEGLRLKVYDCPAGYKTIGVGRNLETNPLSPQEVMALGATQADILAGHEITKDQAMILLDNDIAKVAQHLDKKLPWWRGRSQSVQDALCNVGFQLGVGGLLKFQKGLSCLHAGDMEGAKANFLDSLWAKQTPERARRVVAKFVL